MTRQIKFRAWDSGFKEWIVDTLLFYPQSGHVFNTKRRNFGAETDENVTLMQFTGLLDKNGKEIYEGDIVKWYDTTLVTDEDVEKSIPMLCEFKESMFGFYGNGDSRTGAITNNDKDYREIIGNIYEHPHLLTSEVN